MKSKNPFDREALSRQIEIQKKHAWDLEEDFSWDLGIDFQKPFAPLDENNIVLPGLSEEQRIAWSHLLGMMINETISEMECSLPKLKLTAWEQSLDRLPVNPEMYELGEMFFDEEVKHAESFLKYRDIFCHQTGIDPKDLRRLLPNGLGSHFQHRIVKNAEAGGKAFWWIVAAVEETSVQVFKAAHSKKKEIDPLYYQLHLRHAEEEMRHENYAFLMLTLPDPSQQGLRGRLQKKTDQLLAELVAAPWILTELMKIYRAKDLKQKHPFFEAIASVLPILESMNKAQIMKTLWQDAPYVSWFINSKYRHKHREYLSHQGGLSLSSESVAINYKEVFV